MNDSVSAEFGQQIEMLSEQLNDISQEISTIQDMSEDFSSRFNDAEELTKTLAQLETALDAFQTNLAEQPETIKAAIATVQTRTESLQQVIN